MNLKSAAAGLEAAIPAALNVVAAIHGDNAAEGVKLAAFSQLFQLFAAGVHQIIAASAATAVATPEPPAPNA